MAEEKVRLRSPVRVLNMPSWLAQMVQIEGGRVRFDRFMEMALYDSTHGYYRNRIEAVGSRGDFATSATLSHSLGRAIARWVRVEAKALRLSYPTIIEVGSGSGHLAHTIRKCFRPWERLRYYLVEVAKRPKQRLKSFESVAESVDAAGGAALVFSNELVDAFPCRRLVRTESGWDEIWIEIQDGRWLERTMPIEERPDSILLSASFATGQVVEIHESYFYWLKQFYSSLRIGALLTIDYGGSGAEIYRGKLNGTLRAYFRHQRLEGMEIYRRPGQQDLTADVNFEDLRRWGRILGFSEACYLTQRDFIEKWCPEVLRMNNPATQFLLDPLGAGAAFKVLHQRKIAPKSSPYQSYANFG
jgi:SAM-dependent MidA family methyltransferase